MPLTKTELLYIGLGLAAGAVIGSNWKKIRPMLEPLTENISKGCADACEELATLIPGQFGQWFSDDENEEKSTEKSGDPEKEADCKTPDGIRSRNGNIPWMPVKYYGVFPPSIRRVSIAASDRMV